MRHQQRNRDRGNSGYSTADAHNKKRDSKARRGRVEREGYGEVVPFTGKTFHARTENQARLFSFIGAYDCTFATGPAGTGKTHVALAWAVPFLKAKPCNKIVLTNPAVEIAEKLGTLPGNKDEKIAVSMRPMRDILTKLLGASHLENLIHSEKILFEPLGSILGTTFDDAIIVLDEAQNATPEQMKALLTRVGQGSKIILAGDFKEQKFIDGMSGLEDALKRLGRLHTVGHVEFTVDDIVRSGFCKDVILAYRDGEEPESIRAA